MYGEVGRLWIALDGTSSRAITGPESAAARDAWELLGRQSVTTSRDLKGPSYNFNLMLDKKLPTGPAIAAATLAGLILVGCSRTQGAQARGRDESARPVKVEQVKQETVHRAVEVVGTLAAEDEVTVSSEAEGTVSRIFADLGDR